MSAPTSAADVAASPAATLRRTRQAALHRAAVAYGLLSPAIVLFGIFLVVPLVGAVVLSLRESNGLSGGSFVGGANYSELVRDTVFWRSLGNTVLLAVVSVPLGVGGGLGLALLLREHVPGRGLFRAVFYAPVVISGVVVAMAGRWIFDENIGIVNKALAVVGVGPVAWQSSGPAAMLSVLIMLVWSRMGFCMVVYLAALQGVPGELVEAAHLDGASAWQRFRNVTLPLIRPTTFFLLVMTVIETFHVFDLVYVMTKGGPGNATSLLVTYAYDTGFTARREGYGSAVGVVVLVLMLAVTAVWWRIQRSREAEL